MGTRRVFDYVYAYFLHLFPKLAEEIVKLDRARSFGTIRGHHQPPDFDRPAASLVVSTAMRPAYIMHLDGEGRRVMTAMRWGFSGVNDKTPARPRQIHARGETVDTLKTFADAFAYSRGILMVATFNEAEEVGKRTKQWTHHAECSSAHRNLGDLRAVDQRCGRARYLCDGDDATQRADRLHHGPDAGDPSARSLDCVVWRMCVTGRGEGSGPEQPAKTLGPLKPLRQKPQGEPFQIGTTRDARRGDRQFTTQSHHREPA